MMTRTAVITLVLALLAHADARVHAQSASAWIDVNAAHSRPPTGANVDAASYGLLGARLRVDGKGSTFELGSTTGRGAADGSGGWLSGRAALDASKVKGVFDIGVRAEATGLTYLSAVRLSADSEYKQSLISGTARPYVGVSIAGFRVGAEGMLTRGVWRSEVIKSVFGNPGPGLPLPGRPGDLQRSSTFDDGGVGITGGAASALRVMGPATIEVRATTYDAENQVGSGRYTGVDATLALSLGAVDVTFSGRRWDTPLEKGELGGHAGLGIGIGDAAYLQAVVSRSITDPQYGNAGDIGVSAGLSVRLGRKALGGPLPAIVGSASGKGRVVRFTLKQPNAQSVAVAGDFSGWELRALQRAANGEWTLETVLEPGVYHYSFVVNGETWTVPADAPGLVDDGFGRKNATLVVTAEGDKA